MNRVRHAVLQTDFYQFLKLIISRKCCGHILFTNKFPLDDLNCSSNSHTFLGATSCRPLYLLDFQHVAVLSFKLVKYNIGHSELGNSKYSRTERFRKRAVQLCQYAFRRENSSLVCRSSWRRPRRGANANNAKAHRSRAVRRTAFHKHVLRRGMISRQELLLRW